MSKRTRSTRASSAPKRAKRSTISESTFNTTANSSYGANFDDELETNEIVARLKSIDENERLYCVEMLGKLFADDESNLFDENPSLWQDFLSRFCDIRVEIRFRTVQICSNIFIKRQETRNDILEAYIKRSRDQEENVRVETILAIAKIVNEDYNFLNEKFLTVLKERTLDKKYKVRHEALRTLASYYKRATTENLDEEKKRLDWVKNKILHVYYQCGVEDKLLCEKLLYTTLVPYSLDLQQRMELLFDLYCSIDEHAVKALNEIFKQHNLTRRLVRAILVSSLMTSQSNKGDDENSKESMERHEDAISLKIRSLAERFANQSKAIEQLRELFDYIMTDENALRQVEYIIGDDYSTYGVQGAIKELFQKVGPDSRMAHLNAITRQLMEHCAPVIVDGDGIRILVEKAMSILRGEITIDGVSDEQVCDRGFGLLLVLSCSLPKAFQNDEIMQYFLIFLQHGNTVAADVALQIMANCSKLLPEFFSENAANAFLPELQSVAIQDLPKPAKYATICLASMDQKVTLLRDLIEQGRANVRLDHSHIQAHLAVLTTIAVLAPTEFPHELSRTSVAVVKDVILNDEHERVADDGLKEWRPEEELPDPTRAKLAAVKFLSRWSIGQKNNESSASNAIKTMKLLSAIVASHGDVKKSGRLSYAEKAALRLASAKGLLKMAQERTFISLLTMPQLRILAKMIIDECKHVREHFVSKLQSGLHALKLPLEFMGFYCLTPRLKLSHDEDREQMVEAFKRRIQSYIADNIACRREFLRKNPAYQARPQEFLPEYYLCYVVDLISHLDNFETFDDLDALQEIKECLWFAMEPLLGNTSQDNMNQQFLYKLFQDIKNSRNADNPEDEELNKKLWAVCDMAVVLLSNRVPNYVVKDDSYTCVLPLKCFCSPLKSYNNTDVYLRKEFLPKKNEKSLEKSKVFDKSMR